jgi:hypothetical protein
MTEATREKRRVSTREWRNNHSMHTKEYTQKYRKKNKDRVNENQRRWQMKNPIRALWYGAKARAKKAGTPFSVQWQDIPTMGAHCPLLGNQFDLHRSGLPNAPSLDRIDPKRGYIKGNVWVVGHRANLIKNDGTAEEHEKIARAMRAVEATCSL